MTPLIASVLAAAFVVSLCLVVWLVRAAPGLGWMEPVGRQAHNQHAAPVPNVGGIAIFWGLVIATLAWVVTIWVMPANWLDGTRETMAAQQLMRDNSAQAGVLLAAI
ncbi:MAG: hypothetical protein AAF078_06450, partial [Planctomycetota bacterium]